MGPGFGVEGKGVVNLLMGLGFRGAKQRCKADVDDGIGRWASDSRVGAKR